jgi:uncharacterized protein
VQGQSPTATPAAFTVTRGWLRMPDGVRLSATYWMPVPQRAGQRFPTVLEVLPYRKDDDFALRDWPHYAYLARHGIVGVRVDIRGTGSSEGVLPDREYSDIELADIESVIAELAAMPWSNGKIGMQGISWSAYNAIMTAMRRPPHLAGILVAHGSQDLFGNDIHTSDGALHVDIYAAEMELQNALPQSPNYPIDAAYFKDRFDRPPWTLLYLHHQRDGDFWETGRSLQTDYPSINVPVYAIGALLDGLRDFAIDILANVHAPVKVEMGPWNHAFPNDGEPGPNYDFHGHAAQWWLQTLGGEQTGACCDPKLLVFVRGSVPPGVDLKTTPGSFWSETWPVAQLHWAYWYPQPHAQLASTKSQASTDRLRYVPSSGAGALNWWGETTPDMRAADRHALVYDSPPLPRTLTIIGNPAVRLRVSANAPLANWIVRLEDVRPDGSVSMVTGALRPGAQRFSRTDPRPLVAGQLFTLRFPLHFTTWTYEKGHRIRMVVANAQFPMTWPTPYLMTTSLEVGDGATQLALPVVTANALPPPQLQQPQPPEEDPNGRSLSSQELTPFTVKGDGRGHWTATETEGFTFEVNGRTVAAEQHITYAVDDAHPWKALFDADSSETIRLTGRSVQVLSTVRIASDQQFFHATIRRKVLQDGRLLRERAWSEAIPRDEQ